MFWWWRHLFPRCRVVKLYGGYVAQVYQWLSWYGIDKQDLSLWYNYQEDYCVVETKEQAEHVIKKYKGYNK